jgi:hypothetical protein
MYLVIVFLSMILYMLWLSSKLKRNLIIAQNLTSTTSHFWFGENLLGFEWGINGFGDDIFGIVLGIHIHKESLI